jgi:hypothetical protein
MDRNGEFAVGNINFFRVASPTKDALLTAVAAVPVPSTATPTSPTASNPPQSDIVLYASDVTKAVGNWVRGSFSTGAGGEAMQSKDAGRSNTKEPLAAPSDYFEAQFTPQANKPYRVWMRLRAIADSKFNDSVWLQFSGALDAHGAPLWRIGTTSGLLMNLESCTNCGVSGWGWQTGAWWVSQDSVVRFPAPTEQTLRVQIREDGVQIDQIVISADKYFDAPPGAPINDTNIVSNGPATAAAADPKPNPPTSSLGDASGDATSHNPANQPQDRRHVLGFAPAADHDANVTSYSVALYRADAPPTDQPVASASLGKPDVTNGQISVDISAIVNSLPPGWYYVVVSAHSLAGTAIGPPSTPFPR